MADVEISYKGSTIAALNASGTKTLETEGAYCEDDITVTYTKPSASSPVLQSKTAASTGVEQTIAADSGYDGLSSVIVSPILSGVIRPNAEKVKTYTYDKLLISDENATLPAYSTSSLTTFKASASLPDTYTVDFSNYDYYILEHFVTTPVYSSATKAKGRQDYHICSALYEIINIPANSFKSQSGVTYTSAFNNVNAAGSPNRIVYWSSGSAIAISSSGYGFIQSPVAPTISGSTITMASPDCKVRGNSSVLNSTYYGYVTDVRAQYVFEIYRVPKVTNGVNGWGLNSDLKYIIDRLNSNNWTL